MDWKKRWAEHIAILAKRTFSLAIIFILVFLFMQKTVVNAEEIYINEKYGFSFNSNGFITDDSNESIKTTFFTDYTTVDIFYDNLKATGASADAYINYSNKKFDDFEDSEYIKLKRDVRFKYSGKHIRLIEWERKELLHLEKDFPYYMIMDIKKNNNEVYTIFVNSAEPIDFVFYLKRFNMISKNPMAQVKYKQLYRKENANWSTRTKSFYNEDFSQKPKTELGIFEYSTWIDYNTIKNIEKVNKLKFPYLLEYYSFANRVNPRHIKEVYEDDRILELTFQTSFENALLPEMVYEVLDGKYDDKIDDLAATISSVNDPVFFRLNNEMNGDWCSYNALHFGRDTRLYKEMWKYFYNRIIEKGGDNVIFVFNPNEKSFPNFKWNHYMEYFPGEEYVDIIGVTGYNSGNYYQHEYWRSFANIYDEFMPEYKKRFIGYDFYITEFGSSTYGGNRNKWIDDMLEKINDYGFKLAIYWNGTDWDSSKIRDKEKDKPIPARPYRIDNDPNVMKKLSEYMNK